MANPSTPWLTCYQPRAAALLRLFCLPYAGASGSIYRTWAGSLPDWIEVCPVEWPGRWGRIHEEPFSRVGPLVAALSLGLQDYLDKPFALFGHSVGGLVAFEWARHLRRNTSLAPVHLLTSARRASQLGPRSGIPILHDLSDRELTAGLARYYGSLPQATLDNAELLQIVLPALRADLEMLEMYDYVAGPPLDFPISAYGGEGDPSTKQDDLEAWGHQTTSAFTLTMFPGNHFFWSSKPEPLLAAIAEALARHRPAGD